MLWSDDFNQILFQGFDYQLPEDTLKNISELALQVGSPDYVKTPVFLKRENPMKMESIQKDSGNFKKNKRGGKATEIINYWQEQGKKSSFAEVQSKFPDLIFAGNS